MAVLVPLYKLERVAFGKLYFNSGFFFKKAYLNSPLNDIKTI